MKNQDQFILGESAKTTMFLKRQGKHEKQTAYREAKPLVEVPLTLWHRSVNIAQG